MTDCLFCKIIQKKIPSKTVSEGDDYLAFRDINPQAPTHILVVPKKHIDCLSDAHEEDEQRLGALLMRARDIAKQEQLEEGYRIVLNNGAKAGQTVFHIHIHILGGRPMTWPPG